MIYNKLTCSKGAFKQHNVLDTTLKYLTPDYFLLSSHSESYYSKKYVGNSNLNLKSKSRKISRVASVMLLSLGFLATALEVRAQPNTETSTLGQSTIVPNPNYLFGNSSASISTNAPIPPKMPQSPLVVSSNSGIIPPAPPPAPPIAPSMPDLVSDASSSEGGSNNRSALFESIRNFGKGVLRKVKREPKPKVVSSDGDLMSQLHNTLERRRSGISGEKKSAKPKKVVKQAPKLTEQDIARKKAENLARAATIREQNKKKWEEATKKNEEIARERRRAEAEAVKARLEQKRRERGVTTEHVVNGIDPALHHNIVSDLRSEIALLREQLKGLSSNLGMNTGAAEEPIYSKPKDTISIASSVTEYSEPWHDPDALIGEAFEDEFSTSKKQQRFEPSAPPLSAFSSLEELNITASNTLGAEEEKAIAILDEVLDDSSGYSSGCSRASSSLSDFGDASSLVSTDGYDTVYTSSNSEYSGDSSDEDDLPPQPSADELAALETQHIELEKLTEPVEREQLTEVSNTGEVDYVRATDVLEAASTAFSFTNQEMPEEVSNVADIKDITEELQDENTTSSVLEILDQKDKAEESLLQSVSPNLANIAVTESQEQQTSAEGTITSKDELLKKASMVASSKAQVRQASIIASSHIKHRIFAKDILAAAIAAGDENELDLSQILECSVWSSGAFGTSKQKMSNNTDGYSSKIAGGTIGADARFENDLLLGASFSKLRSNTQHSNQKETKKLDTYIASLYGSSPIKDNLTLGVIGSAGYSKGAKERSKLFSLETHLNYKIDLPQNITLIPNIGLKYEYERSKGYQEQLTSNMSIARTKKSYQAFSTEIGSRVIFAPIRLKEVGTSNVILSNTILTPTAHFSVERRIGSRGASNLYHFTSITNNEGSSKDIGASTLSINPQHQKTSINAGIGLIASHKNIKLELQYDHMRQKRFKSHQGVLKLKVRL